MLAIAMEPRPDLCTFLSRPELARRDPSRDGSVRRPGPAHTRGRHDAETAPIDEHWLLPEREPIARELHDDVSQTLYAIGLAAETALCILERRDDLPGDLEQLVGDILALACDCRLELRGLDGDLRPGALPADGSGREMVTGR